MKTLGTRALLSSMEPEASRESSVGEACAGGDGASEESDPVVQNEETEVASDPELEELLDSEGDAQLVTVCVMILIIIHCSISWGVWKAPTTC